MEIDVNTKAEEKANHLYRKILQQAQKEEDVATAFLIKKILEDVEEHHDAFRKMLKEV